ncbi:MAG: isocitrate/isopropylmalate family dehydrogenase [Bacteroidia bacterium]|nr:isocitrate/isopropylmalate family dehydrogenase [Bacteroidia bacterium]
MKTYRIAVVPGDGIGHEIVPLGMRVVEAAAQKFGFAIETKSFGWGAGYYLQCGEFMAPTALDEMKAYDAIYFGSVGLPAVDDTLPAKDYTFKVRTHFQQYVNYRPVRTYPGVTSPLTKSPHLDFVIIRENTEGEFVQIGSQYLPDMPQGMGVDSSIFTRKGIERIAHYAFKLARKRRNKVTHITKSNTLIHSLTYWDRVIKEVAAQYPDVTHEQMYIDNCAATFVLRPEVFDVVLTTNLFGDILSDLGGAIMGSLGLGGSGNINPEKEFPSMFEPIHGSAPDIAGKSIANPLGQIWSAALMLEHLGEIEAAAAIINGMDATTAAGLLTRDLGGSSSSEDVTQAVIMSLVLQEVST